MIHLPPKKKKKKKTLSAPKWPQPLFGSLKERRIRLCVLTRWTVRCTTLVLTVISLFCSIFLMKTTVLSQQMLCLMRVPG